MVVGKFCCQITGYTYWGPEKTVGSVKLSAVTSNSPGDKEDNEKFFEATPSGMIDLQVINSKAMEQFKPGALYIVTLEKVKK